MKIDSMTDLHVFFMQMACATKHGVLISGIAQDGDPPDFVARTRVQEDLVTMGLLEVAAPESLPESYQKLWTEISVLEKDRTVKIFRVTTTGRLMFSGTGETLHA